MAYLSHCSFPISMHTPRSMNNCSLLSRLLRCCTSCSYLSSIQLRWLATSRDPYDVRPFHMRVICFFFDLYVINKCLTHVWCGFPRLRAFSRLLSFHLTALRDCAWAGFQEPVVSPPKKNQGCGVPCALLPRPSTGRPASWLWARGVALFLVAVGASSRLLLACSPGPPAPRARSRGAGDKFVCFDGCVDFPSLCLLKIGDQVSLLGARWWQSH